MGGGVWSLWARTVALVPRPWAAGLGAGRAVRVGPPGGWARSQVLAAVAGRQRPPSTSSEDACGPWGGQGSSRVTGHRDIHAPFRPQLSGRQGGCRCGNGSVSVRDPGSGACRYFSTRVSFLQCSGRPEAGVAWGSGGGTGGLSGTPPRFWGS